MSWWEIGAKVGAAALKSTFSESDSSGSSSGGGRSSSASSATGLLAPVSNFLNKTSVQGSPGGATQVARTAPKRDFGKSGGSDPMDLTKQILKNMGMD